MIDIEDATDEELFDELARRHRGTLLITLTDQARADQMEQVTRHYIRGGPTLAVGMATTFVLSGEAGKSCLT